MDFQVQLDQGWQLFKEKKYQDATEVFQGILSEDPNEPDALQYMGQIAFVVFNMDAAVDYFSKSLEADPNQFMVWIKLGGLYNWLRQQKKAIACFENAIKYRPERSEGYCQLGLAYLTGGEKEKAEGYLREAFLLDNKSAQAFRLLANSFSLDEEDEIVQRAKDWLSTPNIIASSKIHLMFGMAYLNEKQGRDKEFFQFLQQANDVQKAEAPEWRQMYQWNFSAIKKQFKPETFNISVSEAHKQFTPIFIVGIPRSGSSLIEQIISSHKAVSGVGEVDFMTKFGVNRITVWTKKPFLGGINEVALEQMTEITDVYQKNIRKLAPDHDFITDKFLLNFWAIGLIKMALPWAKVIHAARNPLDNAFSIYRNYFSQMLPYCYSLEDLAEMYVMYRDLMGFWDRTIPGFVFHVGYENLVNNFEDETRRMIDFCGLDWDDACLEPHKNKRSVMTLSQDQVRKPIFNTSIGKWKKFEAELAPFARILEAAGIDPKGPGK